MRLVELILNITYNLKTTSIEPQFWSGELFSDLAGRALDSTNMARERLEKYEN